MEGKGEYKNIEKKERYVGLWHEDKKNDNKGEFFFSNGDRYCG